MIIAGSRNITDYNVCYSACCKTLWALKNDNLISSFNELEIISGAARGADTLGEIFAHSYNVTLTKFPADWEKYGKAAGYIRNKQMAEYASQSECGVLLALWDGRSSGTMYMINLAKSAGLRVFTMINGCWEESI